MVFHLLFCLVTIFQTGDFRPVPHLILEHELQEPWNVHHSTIHSSVYFLEDSGFSPEQAYSKFFNGEFTQIKGRAKFNKGYQTVDWWFGITIENATDKEQLYALAPFNAAIYKVDFYEFDDQGNLVETDSDGYSLPYSLTKRNSRADYAQVILPPKSKKIFLMKIDYNGGRSGTVFFLVNDIISSLAESWGAYYLGHFTGIYTSAIGISILGFLFFRRRVYLYLSVYSLCGLISGLDYDRMLWVILGFEDYTPIGSWLFPVLLLLFTLFVLLFSIEIFKEFGKRVVKIPRLNLFIIPQFVFVILLIGSHSVFEPKQLVFFYTLCHYLGFMNIGLLLVFLGLQVKMNTGLTAFVFFAKIILITNLGIVLYVHLGSTWMLPLEVYYIQFGLMLNLVLIIGGLFYNYFSSQEDKNRLIAEQSETEKQILKLSIEAQDKERQRIAKDLHDDLGSNLAMIKLRMELLMENPTKSNCSTQNLEEIHQMLDGACKDLRYISHELMPADLSTKVMRTMVEELVEKLSVQRKVAIYAQVEDIPILSVDTKVNLFRIIKELMNNVLKHAQATEATIRLSQTPDLENIILEIKDNGKGIPKEVLEGNSKGIGLKNLEKRVEYLKGKLGIKSNRLGTRILVTVPLHSIPTEEFFQTEGQV